MTPHIRPYRAADAGAVGQVFYDAVHQGAAGAYGAAQRAAWAPEVPAGAEWSLRFERSVTFVAEAEGRVVGFMNLVPETGYIDMAYVAPQVMGRGVAHALYAPIEAAGRDAGCATLTTAASALARPFFERQGWHVQRREEVTRAGVRLHRFQMEKVLGDAG